MKMGKLIPFAARIGGGITSGNLALKLLEETGDTTPTATETITNALTAGLQETSNNAMGAIAQVLPYALTIVGAIIVVTLGIKVFKKISGK